MNSDLKEDRTPLLMLGHIFKPSIPLTLKNINAKIETLHEHSNCNNSTKYHQLKLRKT